MFGTALVFALFGFAHRLTGRAVVIVTNKTDGRDHPKFVRYRLMRGRFRAVVCDCIGSYELHEGGTLSENYPYMRWRPLYGKFKFKPTLTKQADVVTLNAG